MNMRPSTSPLPVTAPSSWSLREEAIAASQRWPQIVLFILVGALLGLALAWLFPGPYQAVQDLYVGLDVYRAFRDRNIPFQAESIIDYKNWQLEDLTLVLLSQEVLDQTLELLRQQDGYWQAVDASALSPMLDVNWRNAGKWQLVVEHADPVRALQVVGAWQTAGVAYVQNAVDQSHLVYVLDESIQANTGKRADVKSRLAQFTAAQAGFALWREQLTQMAAGAPLEDVFRQQGWALISPLDLSPAWEVVLQSFPGASAPASSYGAWVDQVNAGLESELASLQSLVDELDNTVKQLKKEYAAASRKSWGLSANLVVDTIADLPAVIRQIRPTSEMLLVGALLGLITWLLLWLGRIGMRGSQRAKAGA